MPPFSAHLVDDFSSSRTPESEIPDAHSKLNLLTTYFAIILHRNALEGQLSQVTCHNAIQVLDDTSAKQHQSETVRI